MQRNRPLEIKCPTVVDGHKLPKSTSRLLAAWSVANALLTCMAASAHPVTRIRESRQPWKGDTMTKSDFRWDVCLSFAGEDRPYVAKVAAALKKANIRIFYDAYEQVDLWGKNLYDHLHNVYSQEARYCVMFVSKHYAEKTWPNKERQSAQARALEENQEYILPARFDDTDIKGLQTTVAYVDLRKVAPKQFADLIVTKLNRPEIKERTAYRFLDDGQMRVVPQKTFGLEMEFDREVDHDSLAAVGSAFPMPPFEDCEINTRGRAVVVKGLVDAWADAEAMQIVADAAFDAWNAAGPKDAMIVTIEQEKRHIKHGRIPGLRIEPPPRLNLQRCLNPKWKDAASYLKVDSALQRLGFQHAANLWIPDRLDSLVAAYVNELDFVICQYHEKEGSLPISISLSSHYQDGKVLTDDYSYVSGAHLEQEIELLYSRHLRDRTIGRPDAKVVFVNMNKQLEKWGAKLRLWPIKT